MDKTKKQHNKIKPAKSPNYFTKHNKTKNYRRIQQTIFFKNTPPEKHIQKYIIQQKHNIKFKSQKQNNT